MPTDVTVISARRIFDFKFDDLRLSMLSSATYKAQLQELFHFASAVVRTPPATLAPVVSMDPPGLTFSMGEWVDPRDGRLVVVRHIHFEPIRLVIDVAGPSEWIDPIYATVRAWADSIQVPDGGPCIGEPFAVSDLSELTATLDVPVSSILQPGVIRALRKGLPDDEGGAELQIVPALSIRFVPKGSDFLPGPAPAAFLIEHRSAVPVEEGRWYSHAMLDTQRHLEVLAALESSGRSGPRRRPGRVAAPD